MSEMQCLLGGYFLLVDDYDNVIQGKGGLLIILQPIMQTFPYCDEPAAMMHIVLPQIESKCIQKGSLMKR